jgi:type IV pilus assembly protein PilB
MPYTRDRLGELLVRTGIISEDQLLEILDRQSLEGGKLGALLIRTGLVDEETIARTLAEQKSLEYVNLHTYAIDREAAAQVPERVARRSHIIPIDYRDEHIVLAMADPLDVEAIDDVSLRSGHAVLPVVATASQIEYAIEKFITSADAFEGIAQAAEDEEEQAVAVGDEDVPIVRLVNQIIREAVLDDASDIHFEPGEHSVRVRFRVDGVLHEVMQIPSSARPGLISRMKVMAEMDIAERRRPQDGRIGLAVNDRPIDMRVATLPTPYGENIVIRILNHDAVQPTLTDLGMRSADLALVERLLSRPYGEILVSGPTGSGKSTTLYAALRHLNEVTRKIITIEDPIELRLPGVTQMAVNPHIGLSFAQLLRTVLRSDPDVVMVGEIRDAETAQIATRAALTGHLVLSSIHTNDAPSALTRLVDMDVAPFITSSALLGVVAQRLVRKLCPSCRTRVRYTKPFLAERHVDPAEVPVGSGYGAADGGCDDCHGTGYRGRVGVFEILAMDEEIEHLFLSSAPSEEIRAAAIRAGMRTLRDDAMEKVAEGITSLDEVIRVIV